LKGKEKKTSYAITALRSLLQSGYSRDIKERKGIDDGRFLGHFR